MSELVHPNGLLLSEINKAHAGEGKSRAVGLTPWRDLAINGRGPNGATTKKGRWSDYYGMYRRHSIVRAAVEKIAKTATNVGYDFVPRDSRAKIKTRELNILKGFFDQQHDFVYELRRVYKDLLIYGDAYLYIVPDRRRRPSRLKRLHPKTIHIKADIHGSVQAYYQKNPDDITTDAVRYEPFEILHFRIDDPDNDLYGLSPLESLKDAVAADIYAQVFNGAFFKNSAVTGTIIAIKNANPDEIQRNREWLEANYQGPEAAHKPLVIEGENVTVEKSVANHNEMGFLDGRRFIISEILAVLDVPPSKIGMMESANRSNSKEQDKTFRTESVKPLQFIVEQVINDGLIRNILGVENTIFQHSEADARDQLEQMDYYTKGEAWGIFTPNEIRAKLGMAPVDGGDTPFIMSPTGAVPLDRMDLYFRLPQPNTDDTPTVERDPPEGEEMEGPVGSAPEPTTASKSLQMNTALAAQGMILKLAEATENDTALRQAYSYAVDASETGDTRLQHVAYVLEKACRAQDAMLKKGYIERAQEAVGQFIQPVTSHLERLSSTDDESPFDDDADYRAEAF